MTEKRKLSARQVLEDVKDGWSDDQLMSKHQLTARELQGVLRKLVEAGWLTQSQLDARSALLGGTGQAPPPTGLGEEVDFSRQEIPSETTPEPRNPAQLTGSPDPTEEESVQDLFGDWYESKKNLIWLLIFATPMGLYGLYRTSLFPKKTKIGITIVAILIVVVAPAVLKLWVVGGVWIVSYSVYKLLPFGKAARIAISVSAGLLVMAMCGSLIDRNSGRSGTRKVPAQPVATTKPVSQPTQSKPVPVAQPTTTTQKDAAKSADSEEDKKKKFYDCFDPCVKKCPSLNAWKYALRKQGITGDLADSVAKQEMEKCEKKCLDDCGGNAYSK